MKDPRQFEAGPNATSDGSARSGPFDSAGLAACATIESWLAESAENALPSAIAEPMRLHAAGCAACHEKLAQARSGREWLLVLKQESLEPPADLVAKILARTSLAGTDAEWNDAVHSARSGHAAEGSLPLHTESTSIPAWQHSSVVVLRRTLFEPRLALVAAMAFFSISLTLNILGVRLTRLHAADLAPRNMHRAVVRQVADTDARVVRYYENLRIVYEMEARVQQLRRAAETTTPAPQATPPKQPSGSSGNSTDRSTDSHRDGLAAQPDPKPITTRPRMDAAFDPAQTVCLGCPILAASSAARVGRLDPSQPNLSFRAERSRGPQRQVFVAGVGSEVEEPAFLLRDSNKFASSCSLPHNCFSMRYFSARERRLA